MTSGYEDSGDDYASIWDADLLERRSDAEFLLSFLRNRISEGAVSGRRGSYVINLDAGWGEGKTFFLTRLKDHIEKAGHIAVYVNAWRDEHADDPLLAVMSAIDDAIAPFLTKRNALRKAWQVTKSAGVEIAVATAKHGLLTLMRKAIGEGIAELGDLTAAAGGEQLEEGSKGPSADIADGLSAGVEALGDRTAEAALAAFRQEQRSIDSFRKNLERLLINIGKTEAPALPLFVLIDELDRCRPTYAIRLLERVNHLFDVANVAFVVATDSTQLRHSIKAVYGSTFDSTAYLRRFFDRAYQFEEPSIGSFLNVQLKQSGLNHDLLELPPQNELLPFLVDSVDFFGISLRDIEQCVDILHTVMTTWRQPLKVQLGYLWPLVVAFQQGNAELWEGLERCDSEFASRFFRRPPGDRWTLTFMQHIDTFQSRPEQIDYAIYLSRLLHGMSLSLVKSVEERPRGEPGTYIQRLFHEEFLVLHQNTHDPRSPPYSILRRYPEFVRNAGRIRLEVE